MKIVIIAEKYSVAEKIAYYLSDGKAKRLKKKNETYFEFEKEGNEYYVLGLKGHVIELDYPEEYKDWKKEDLENLITVETIKKVKHKNTVDLVKELLSDADEVIIATDYDREGELIGREIIEVANYKGKIKRAKFSAVTKGEILESFKNLENINNNLADAAESRQKIDLIWGATLTRFFSLVSNQRWKNFISVGRVQSPTLALIVNREREIQNFVPKSYWDLVAYIGNVKAEHTKNPFWEKPDEIYEKIKNEKEGQVVKYEEFEKDVRPPIPFNTTEFLREATKLGISVGRAMTIAEDLYSNGYISYPRTDNTVYPRTINLISIVKLFEDSEYGKYAKNILKREKIIPTRGKVETTDHPPIYPVKSIKKGELKGDYLKIYDLVVRRFLATLYDPAKILMNEADINIKGEIFSAKGIKIIDEGWMEVYPFLKIKERPLAKISGNVRIDKIEMVENKTKPPERYNQATLIKEMENLNLGTKSTRHEIIEKLYERKYIEGSTIRPTNLGISLVNAMEKNNVDAIKPEMTAKLEKDMDMIEKGNNTKENVVNESREMLKKILKELFKNEKNISETIKNGISSDKIIGKCPKCGSDLYLERGNGYRYVVCSKYPECDFRFYLPKTGQIELTDDRCPVCGLPLIRVKRKGQNVETRCINPKCEYNLKNEILGVCPEDGGNIVVRQGRNGKKFAGCSNYPKCKVIYPLPQKGKIIPTGEKCKICNSPIVIVDYGKNKKKICLNPKCENNRGIGDE
ncbi:MAG: DNA topoisomerase I [Thermoplasmata archaeon]